jgi:hypothetical protein
MEVTNWEKVFKLLNCWHHQYIEYRRQYEAIIIIILSWYGTSGFVLVWYHHDTDSGNLEKNIYV